jgi:hypothetical protein
VSAVVAASITAVAATITWTTDETSDSQVEYGLTTAYGSSTTLNASLVTAHSAALSGLSGSTLYHYRVRSRDAAGNLAVSGDFTFTTLAPPDTTPPAVSISAPAAGATVSSTVTVSATASDNVGVAGVQFKLNGANLGAEDTTAPYSVSWDTTTAANGAHTLTAVARDAAGNTTTSTGVGVTVANDTTAPTISAVTASSITASAATITWTTNETSDSQVEYGTTTAYGSSSVLNASLVTAHSAALTGFSGSTLYHYRVRSRDAAGNLALSGDFTFTTLAPPDTTPPAVSISAPAAGATVSSTVTVSATASDNVGVAGVQFKLNGANLGAEDTTAPYSVSWNTTTAADGPHTLTAAARDAAGNAATSAAVSVTVANGVSQLSLSPQDTSLNINATNYSADPVLTTYTWPANQVANAILMKFDLSSVPAGAVVQSATLDLTLVGSDAAADATYTVTAHKVVAKNPVITAATGYTSDGVTAWTPNACCYNNVPLAQADIAAAYDTRAIDKVLGRKSWTITGIVQEWLTAPAANFGILLNSDASKAGDRYRYFASMEHSDASMRPALQITYTLAPDTTAPVISAVAASSLTASGAIIRWTTNEPGSSQVEYGTTTAYGSSSALDGSLLTSHAAALSGLSASTLYHYRVRSRDAAGNLAVSGDFTFTTLAPPDTTPPAVSISAPAAGATVSSTVTVSATASDNVGVTGVQFKLDGANLGAEDTASPYSVSWNTTTATNGSHTLTAVARDAAANQTTSSGVTVTVSNIVPGQVTLTWDPNSEPDLAGYKVYVGESSRVYTLTLDVGNLATYTVTGLQAGHTYYFAVTAYDTSGNEGAFSTEVSTTLLAAVFVPVDAVGTLTAASTGGAQPTGQGGSQ